MRVLVVEDDRATREGLETLLGEFRLEVKSVATLADAQCALLTFAPDVCLTDLMLPDGDGLEFVRQARAENPDREVVVLTGHGSVETAVEAMKAGAFDYLVKPLRAARLEAVLERLRPTGAGTVEEGLARLDETGRFGTMIGRSRAMREMCQVIARIAKSDAPVMIFGESGSGKEAAAQTIHALSRRRDKPLVAVNCGAVSSTLIESELFGHEKGAFTGAEKRRSGYFELAQGGTLFLDEVTEMPLDLQVKFLRVLETRTFRRVGGNDELETDVRILSSSNRDLLEAIHEKKLREDLYYRLNVLPLHVVPLREKREDIPLLADAFVGQIAEREKRGRRTFTAGARERLAAHPWKGNVRELRNVVHRAYVLSDGAVIDERTVASVLGHGDAETLPSETPPDVAPPGGSAEQPLRNEAGRLPAEMAAVDDPLVLRIRIGDSLEDVERLLIERTLAAVEGNKKRTAEILKISLKTVYNKIRQYGLEP